MDPRWALAVRVSTRWYDAIFGMHDIPTVTGEGVWRSLSPPPPLHSAVKTLGADASLRAVRRAVALLPATSVADSFGALDLRGEGFRPLIDASWIHHPGAAPSRAPAWSRVTGLTELREWVLVHGTDGLFLPSFLDRDDLWLMARRDARGVVTGGLVLQETSEAVGLSNVFAAPGRSVTWDEVMTVVGATHPGRPTTDYTDGEDLEAALGAGFSAVGRQVVWIRCRRLGST